MSQTVRIEVLRAFWLSGQEVARGTTLEVGRTLALELCGANKARLLPDDPAPAAIEPPAPPARPARASKSKEPTA